jgi:hypothetical protein
MSPQNGENGRAAEKPSAGQYNTTMNEEERLRRLNEAMDNEDSWLEWYRLTPLERWRETSKLWQFYLEVGGSLDPEPDPQSPFDSVMPRGTPPAYGGASLRVIRRGRV